MAVTDPTSPPQPDWSWNEMLAAFCELGGAAQNIALEDGQLIGGLVAIDRTAPVLLRVPRNLLVRIEDIEFRNGQIGIRETAEIPEAERRFFKKYQAAFSWCPRGEAEATVFVSALDALPLDVRQFLIAEFGLGYLFQGEIYSRVQAQFLRSRAIPSQRDSFVAPLLELAGFGAEGLIPERGKHLQIQGYVSREIKVRYGAEDACSAFFRFGAPVRQEAAYSVPMRVRFEDREIVIGRATSEASRRGNYRLPATSTEDDRVSLSYLMLGHRRLFRGPRGIARTLLREAGLENPDEAFDRIVRYNAVRFIKLLEALEAHDGGLISALRTMARYQLEAMNYCIGSREPGHASV